MPSTTYHASDFLRAAERIGVPVTVGTDGSQAFHELVPGSTITLDFDDLAGAGAEVAAFHRRFPIGAVVAAVGYRFGRFFFCYIFLYNPSLLSPMGAVTYLLWEVSTLTPW